MTKFWTISLTAFALFALFSCSEDKDTTKNTETELFPMKIGSYWVYDAKEFDAEGKETGASTDSMAISRTTTKLDKECFEFKTYVDGQHDGDFYQYKVGAQLFTLLESILPEDNAIGLPFGEIEDQWVIIADLNASQWNIYELDLNGFDIDYGGIGGKLNGTFKMVGKKGNKVILDNIMGASHTAQEFVIENIITGKFSITSLPFPITVDVDSKIIARSYYVDGIGLIKSSAEPTTIDLVIPGIGLQKLPVPGNQGILLRTNVK
ncbi:MAG: hypothetical protein KGZ71_10505 [Desulfobulbaceae bacterium]|nr:hypothetical protein [Candidatus Kapabacteria bacterium]MBS4000899.1 hypothetical protein [Desulfobulbaceae bacterium]